MDTNTGDANAKTKLLKLKLQEFMDMNETYSSLSAELSEIRSQKNDLENEINNMLRDLNMENKTFMLNDNKIQQKRTVQYQGLSMKYIESCLEGELEEEDAQRILEIIKKNRSSKEKSEIKIL